MCRSRRDDAPSTDTEVPHDHHPPYAWLGAAVLFWGMVALWLAPMLWTWLGVGAQQPGAQVDRLRDSDQVLPHRVPRGTVMLPSTCHRGDIFFTHTAAEEQQMYGCAAPNTWIQMDEAHPHQEEDLP
jgi:hypothetical protein